MDAFIRNASYLSSSSNLDGTSSFLCSFFFIELRLCSRMQTEASGVPQNKSGCGWLEVITLTNKMWRNCPMSIGVLLNITVVQSHLAVYCEPVVWFNYHVKITLQFITVIKKKIIAAAKHWFIYLFSLCFHYTACHLNLCSVWCHIQWICLINVYAMLKMKQCLPPRCPLECFVGELELKRNFLPLTSNALLISAQSNFRNHSLLFTLLFSPSIWLYFISH